MLWVCNSKPQTLSNSLRSLRLMRRAGDKRTQKAGQEKCELTPACMFYTVSTSQAPWIFFSLQFMRNCSTYLLA